MCRTRKRIDEKMTFLTLDYLVKNYNINYPKVIEVNDKFQDRLIKQAYENKDYSTLYRSEEIFYQSIKKTERYCRIFKKERSD